jgi:hypothetical protein
MGDFLTNLAVRSAGSAEVIQPRLPSLFEPPRLSLGSLDGFDFVRPQQQQGSFEETLWQTDVHRADVHNHIAGQPTPVPFSAEVPRAELETEPRPASRPQARDPRRAVWPSLSVRHETPLDPVVPPTLPGFQPFESGSKSSASSNSLVRKSLVAAVPSESGKDVSEGMLPTRDSAHSSEAAVDAHARAAETKSSLTDSKVRSEKLTAPGIESPYLPPNYPSRPARSIIEPCVTPRSAEARRGAASSRFKPVEPIVQVTIGRIEVRAIPQEPAARRERSVSPVMSLDEYLRTRGKRGGK